MGQITAKIYQKACIYDHSVNGSFDNITPKLLGMSIIGGDSITKIHYTVISPLVFAGAGTKIQCGWMWAGASGFIDPLHTVAVMNAAIGRWLYFDWPIPGQTWPKEPIGNTLQNEIAVISASADTIISGSILFSFTLMSHPL